MPINVVKSKPKLCTANTILAGIMLTLIFASLFFPLYIAIKTTFYDDYSNGKYLIDNGHIEVSLKQEELHQMEYVNNHEVIFNNKLYDIVQKLHDNGTWHFVLYDDIKEQKDLTILHQTHKQQSKNKRVLTNFLFLINAPLQHQQSNTILPVTISKLNEYSFSFYNYLHISTPFRPPCRMMSFGF